MSPIVTKPTYPKAKVPESDRCIFTSSHGQRCLNPHMDAANKFCLVHQRHLEKINDAELQSISDELFSGGPNLSTREELGCVMAKLFTLIAQKRVSRHDGALLAYVASLLLQTMLPTATPPVPPVKVVWDIPLLSPSELEERQNADAQFPNRK
jgi:hypothetical protein